ncbi:hypothetical protein [Streptomyces sp. NPDC004330]|uniref:hypothetical protein n=1 Tax=Streptomyces sp. NPDC004330 TaxID=3364700 RepID=UPI00367BD5B8
MNPNSTPSEGLYGRQSDDRTEEASREPGAATGPQTAAYAFWSVEEHHWDAEKTAEAARILVQYPPRNCITTTTADWTEDPKDTP